MPFKLVMGSEMSRRQFHACAQEVFVEKERLEAQVATLKADPNSWQSGYDEGRKMGTKTALSERDQLKAENEVLREGNDKLTRRNGMLEENVKALSATHVRYTWLRKKVDQPYNDFVSVTQNIGHDWIVVHDLDRAVDQMIGEEQP
jgi:FtsZ-binding cell division protein ZapB